MNTGMLTGVVVYGAALGGIFALVFAYARGRMGRLSPRATAAVLGVCGFITLILIPQIKYPANPPSIGDPATIGSRTALYFTMIALSVIAAIAAVSTGRQLARRLEGWNASIAAGAAYIIVVAAAMLILPPVNEVPTGFSAGSPRYRHALETHAAVSCENQADCVKTARDPSRLLFLSFSFARRPRNWRGVEFSHSLQEIWTAGRPLSALQRSFPSASRRPAHAAFQAFAIGTGVGGGPQTCRKISDLRCCAVPI